VQQLGHVPSIGETASIDGHVLTVVELDGRRVARVKVAPVPSSTQPPVERPEEAAVDVGS
jgi:putative hemolysin